MADRPRSSRRAEVPLPPMPAAWREPAEGDGKPAPRPPSIRHQASGPPVVQPPRPPRMAPRRAVPPPVPVMPRPGPVFGPGVPTYTPQPLTSVVPVAVPRSRPVSPIPYPGLPLSVPPMGAGVAPGVVPTGFHPETGEPMSDRSGFTAGLLQIFLGAFGAGRLYTGHVAIALLQMATGLFLFMFTLCAGMGLGFDGGLVGLLWVAVVWPVVDGIKLLGWGGHDANGHRLL